MNRILMAGIDPVTVFVGILAFLVGAYAVTMLLLGVGIFFKRIYNDARTTYEGKFTTFTLAPFMAIIAIIVIIILGAILWEIVKTVKGYF